MEENYIAVDLGASSGRLMRGCFGRSEFQLEEIHRFPNSAKKLDGHLRWNTEYLFDQIKTGLEKVRANNLTVVSLGVDAWGVDYGLFDSRGELLEEPVAYRDPRTQGVMDEVLSLIARDDLFSRTGIQFLPINTLYQIVAQTKLGEWPEQAEKLLMLPDIFHYYLSGEMVGEYTNATTTQLLNAREKSWDPEIFSRLNLPLSVMPKLVQPGHRIGALRRVLQVELGLPSMRITAPSTHDTASAVVGTPLRADWGYISSGTWSLVGVETKEPILSAEACHSNFTNEGGAENSNRFLKNVAGLWILEQCRQEWARQGARLTYDDLIVEMRSTPPFQAFINPDDSRFLNPTNMVAEVTSYLRETGQATDFDQIGLSRVILESMAMRYASIFDEIQKLTGNRIAGVHIVGGGSQNDFLNQATANATRVPVLAGPSEATAIGNLAVQAIADGRFPGMRQAREYIEMHLPVRRYAACEVKPWREAYMQYERVAA